MTMLCAPWPVAEKLPKLPSKMCSNAANAKKYSNDLVI